MAIRVGGAVSLRLLIVVLDTLATLLTRPVGAVAVCRLLPVLEAHVVLEGVAVGAVPLVVGVVGGPAFAVLPFADQLVVVGARELGVLLVDGHAPAILQLTLMAVGDGWSDFVFATLVSMAIVTLRALVDGRAGLSPDALVLLEPPLNGALVLIIGEVPLHTGAVRLVVGTASQQVAVRTAHLGRQSLDLDAFVVSVFVVIGTSVGMLGEGKGGEGHQQAHDGSTDRTHGAPGDKRENVEIDERNTEERRAREAAAGWRR
mmetsp:Transcript_20625/g.50249  ORF Transcript_20625/g.50249 Transcript_20625/m.50249 type:complete len:260 (+) Transcript_20625:3552-4331(+)